MTDQSILVLAKQAERLRPVFESIPESPSVRLLSDLAGVEEIAAKLNPAIIVIYKEAGFEGPEFRRLSQMRSVKWVHVSGSGYEFLEPIDRRGLMVTNGLGLRSRDLAEMTLGAMLAFNTGLLTYRDQQRNRNWLQHAFRPMSEQILLVIGTGKIGTWVGRYARTLGMRVIGVNRSGHSTEDFDEVVRFDDLGSALPRADIVTLHLRLTAETRGLFNAEVFGLMKPGALFVNTARGGIVDQRDLCDALQNGNLGGAYLDVFETEPLPENSPLWAMDKLLITPHAADMIVDWDIRAGEFFVENFERWRTGQTLVNIVKTSRQAD